MKFIREIETKNVSSRDSAIETIKWKLKKFEKKVREGELVTVYDVLDDLGLDVTYECLYHGWCTFTSYNHIFCDIVRQPNWNVLLVFRADDLGMVMQRE